MAGKSRVNARITTLAVLEILKTQTDINKKLGINDIVRILKLQHDINTNRDTVKRILADLQEFYQDNIMCDMTKRVLKNEDDCTNYYTYNYYYKKLFSDEEIQFLINDVLFSKMRTKEQVKELTDKLKTMASLDCRKNKLGYTMYIPDKQYTLNDKVQRNISVINDVITFNGNSNSKEAWINFTFNGYGDDKELHSTGDGYKIYPICICEANQNYYLVGYMYGKYLSHYRIDLMTNLKIQQVARENNEDRQAAINSFKQTPISEYLSSHPYMFYESDKNSIKNITIRIKKNPKKPQASMTFLYNVFGRSWEVVKGTDNENFVDVRIRCLTNAMYIFVKQYIEDVEVINPPDIKKEIEDKLREDFRGYFE